MPNKDLRIKKQGQRAEVHLISGASLTGDFFLSGQAQSRRGSETLMDVFNDSLRVYLPFTEGESGAFHLLNKRHIVMVELQESDLSQVLGFDSESDLPTQSVRLSYGSDDSSLSGEAYVGDLHPDNRRLADLLNHEANFFLLLAEEKCYLVNKYQMHFAAVG
jgi:hypothetical protein